MSSPIEKDLSKANKWYVGKARTYELRYFVKQYDIWRTALTDLNLYYASVPKEIRVQRTHDTDHVDRLVASIAYYQDRIDLVNQALAAVDPLISKPILISVINDISYNELLARYDIPYGRDLFYDKVRQFIWTLDKLRQ